MKKYIFLFCSVLVAASGYSQFAKDSADLIRRLETFMQYNRDLNFDKVMDYTYPKLFTIATKEQIKEVMESAFNSDELNIKMDSIKTEKVYPLFASGNNRYAKISYSMLLLMSPKPENDSTNMNILIPAMKGQFGDDNVRFNEKTNTLIIYQKVDMAAIKDDISLEWTFMNLKKDDPIMELLLDKKMLSKFYSF
jgi:hypothetical protein